MSDRDAKLKITTELVGMDEAAKKTADLADAMVKAGGAAEGEASGLNQAATAADRLEVAEVGAAAGAKEAADALEGVAVAASESSQATADGASRAAGALDAVTVAAADERAALLATGDAAGQAGAEATTALDQVTAAEGEAAAGARALGQATEKAATEAEGFRAGVTQIEAMGQAIRESGLALEVQRQGLRAVIGEVESLVAEEIRLGSKGEENANLAGNALIGLKARLADVNAEIRREVEALQAAGVAGSASGTDVSEAQGLIAARIALVEAAVKKAETQFLTSGQIERGSVREVTETFEALQIAIEQTAGTTDAATGSQVAALERLRGKQEQLNATANRLTNATKDNSIALQEGEQQIAGVANAAQNLVSVFDMQQITTTALVGKTGSLAMAYGQLKDSVQVMDLNTLKAGASAAKMSTQLGLVVAAAIAASVAGQKLADTNSQNAEVMDDVTNAAKRLSKEALADTKDQVSGLQSAFQSLLIAGGLVLDQTVKYGAESKESEKASADLSHAIDELTIAFRVGETGVKLYNIARRDGLSAERAYALAVADSAEVMKFYTDSTKAGAAGQKLWARGLAESGGDAERMARFVRDNAEQMARLTTETAAQTEAQKKNNVQIAYAIDLARLKGDSDARLLSAEEAALYRLSTARQQEEEAQNGLTVSLRNGLTEIQGMISASDLNAGALRNMSAATQEVLGSTKNLTAAERERIAIALDLSARGDELTLQQRAYVAALIDSILAQDKATTSGAALAQIQKDIDRAQKGTTETLQSNLDVLATLTTSWDTNSIALRVAAAELAQTLEITDGLTDAQRLLYEQIVNGIKGIDALTKSKADLIEEQNKLLDVGMQMTAEQYKTYQANQAEIYSIQGKIEATKSHAEAQIANLQTTKEVTISTNQLIKNSEGVWTNIGTAQKSAAEGAKAAGDETEAAATKVGEASTDIGDASGKVSALGAASAATASSVRSVGKAAMDAASELSESGAEWTAETARIAAARAQYEGLRLVLRDLHTTMRGITEEAERMGPALEKAGDSATKASGYASSKVQEAG